MPKYVEMSVTDVVHESEIFGAFMPSKEKQGKQTEDAEEEGENNGTRHV